MLFSTRQCTRAESLVCLPCTRIRTQGSTLRAHEHAGRNLEPSKAYGLASLPWISSIKTSVISRRIYVSLQHSLLPDSFERTLSLALSKIPHTSGVVPYGLQLRSPLQFLLEWSSTQKKCNYRWTDTTTSHFPRHTDIVATWRKNSPTSPRA